MAADGDFGGSIAYGRTCFLGANTKSPNWSRARHQCRVPRSQINYHADGPKDRRTAAAVDLSREATPFRCPP